MILRVAGITKRFSRLDRFAGRQFRRRTRDDQGSNRPEWSG